MAKERRDTKNRILGKGEYQKADGRYMYRYTDSTGETRFVYSWTLTQSDRPPKGVKPGLCLRELEKQIAKDVYDGINSFQAAQITLNDCWEQYISSKLGLKPTTLSGYKRNYRKHIRNGLGKKTISSIKYSTIKNFYVQLLQSGLKIGTIKGIQTILHPVFAGAVRDGYIRTNPTDGVIADIVKSLHCETKKRHALTEVQQAAFMNFVREHKIYKHWLTMFTVMLGTGCRIGEVLGLRWEDCDFQNNIIEINHTLTYAPDEDIGRHTFHISTPKTKAGIREIPMFKEVKKALLAEKKRQMRSGIKQPVVDGYSGFVFLTRNGTVFNTISVYKATKYIVQAYNLAETKQAKEQNREPVLLPHFSAHNLRHTFCTRLCENEKNLKVVQEIMGHSNIGITMDIYNEATREQKQKSFESLEGKLKIC